MFKIFIFVQWNIALYHTIILFEIEVIFVLNFKFNTKKYTRVNICNMNFVVKTAADDTWD